MAVLLNGDGYQGITAQEDADLYAGLAGSGRLVLNVGRKMECEIIDNNTVRVYDGELISKGRRIHIDAGTWDDFTIPTGSQGEIKYFTLGYRLYNDGGQQKCEAVLKTDSNLPVYTEHDLRDGSAETYVSLYCIKQEGLNLTNVTALYTNIASLENAWKQLGILGAEQKVLWSGTSWPSDTQTVTFSGKISEQKTGIVLVWSRYDSGAKDEQIVCSFIPKKIASMKDGKGFSFTLIPNSFSTAAVKYVYVSDTRLVGHADNTAAGTGACGLKYNNKYFCLRYVIGI